MPADRLPQQNGMTLTDSKVGNEFQQYKNKKTKAAIVKCRADT
jgi:hypothetical protein